MLHWPGFDSVPHFTFRLLPPYIKINNLELHEMFWALEPQEHDL